MKITDRRIQFIGPYGIQIAEADRNGILVLVSPAETVSFFTASHSFDPTDLLELPSYITDRIQLRIRKGGEQENSNEQVCKFFYQCNSV